jgi:hypothetical protein
LESSTIVCNILDQISNCPDSCKQQLLRPGRGEEYATHSIAYEASRPSATIQAEREARVSAIVVLLNPDFA